MQLTELMRRLVLVLLADQGLILVRLMIQGQELAVQAGHKLLLPEDHCTDCEAE